MRSTRSCSKVCKVCVCKSDLATESVGCAGEFSGFHGLPGLVRTKETGVPVEVRDVTHPPRAALHPVPDLAGAHDALPDLAAVLWQERELLEDLLYALVQQHHILAAGQARWLPRADAAVAAAARAVQTHEVLRAIEVENLVSMLGLPASASLLEIAGAAGEPWHTLLQDHRTALRSLAAELDRITTENRAMLVVGERSTREALEQAGVVAASGPVARYDNRGGIARASASILDEHA
jgi:hypothetical protein